MRVLAVQDIEGIAPKFYSGKSPTLRDMMG